MSWQPRHRVTHVYFIKPAGMSGPIKIGCSYLPANRLIDLTMWSPFKLEVIGFVEGTTKDERFLHRCFAHLHSHAEWFHPAPQLQEAIQNILEKGVLYARDNLTPTGKIRSHARSPEFKARMSVSQRKSWAQRKAKAARFALDKQGAA